MNRRQYAIVVSFSIALLAAALVPLSGQQGSSYNPWLDYDDSGVIDVEDLHALGSAYGTSGTPLNSPMALEYDSGWIDIHDKQGQYFDIVPGFNLETATWFPRIYGRTAASLPMHQKCWYGYEMPGWNKTYGGKGFDYVFSLVQASDGGYAAAGYTYSFGVGTPTYANVWLVKTDALGTMEWNKTYGGDNHDFAYSLIQTSDGGYAIAGSTKSFGSGDEVYLVKTDALGTMEWNKTYGGYYNDFAYSLIQTSDGGYAIAGYTYSFGWGVPDHSNVWLVKTDASGTMEWNEWYGGIFSETDDVARSVVQTSDEGYMIAGYTFSYGLGTPTYANVWLVKTDASGTMEWNKTYGGQNSDDWGFSLIKTSDGGYAIAGYTIDYGAGTPAYSNSYLVKTDSSGNMLWERVYGGAGPDNAHSLIQTSDGGYAIAGLTYSFDVNGIADVYLVKTDSSGIMQWDKTYGGTSGDYGRSVVQTADGGYAIAGYTFSFGLTDGHAYLVKTDAFGQMDLEHGVTIAAITADSVTFYRGTVDPYYNYIRVRLWVAKESP